MVDMKIIVGGAAAFAVVVVLGGLFDSEVHHSDDGYSGAMASQSMTSASAQAQMGAPMMYAQTPAQLLAQNQAQTQAEQAQAPTFMADPMGNPLQAPSFVNVAAPPRSGASDPTLNETGQDVPNFLPQNIQISEAHWQGMDVTILTAELRQKLRYPRGLLGLLVDEVTLNAARSGLMAGDIIVNVGNVPVTTLEEFQQATRMVRNMEKVELTSLRKGEMGDGQRYTMRRVSVALIGDPDVGFAQLESAPMIVAGDGRPHPYRGACTNCHAIGVGFELTPDPDLITLPPPQITLAIAEKGVSPHRDRGPCEACHQIVN
ncbi:magnetosome magnetite formation protein MamP [Magnetovibrio blakemorei]|uniref:Magnetosome protein MamP n=2 Tax=Pseudomonadota TaxID=1224 RepID=C4RAG6_9PROT|nr:magnetosome magnetite formation protein MamP [Magnetovibrio blakemorei]ASN76796.1 MamP [Vibrio sp. MV-1]OEJ67300.1 hypothetical protein BEN30_00250 [Magnetovibrio blakemorei]CAV30811.1 magnetosome protein MamP [Magnetovibrio blakemorei]